MYAIAITVFVLSLILLIVSLVEVAYYLDFCRETIEGSRRQYTIRRDFENGTYMNQRNLDPDVYPCRMQMKDTEEIHYLYIRIPRIPRTIFKTGEGET